MLFKFLVQRYNVQKVQLFICFNYENMKKPSNLELQDSQALLYCIVCRIHTLSKLQFSKTKQFKKQNSVPPKASFKNNEGLGIQTGVLIKFANPLLCIRNQVRSMFMDTILHHVSSCRLQISPQTNTSQWGQILSHTFKDYFFKTVKSEILAYPISKNKNQSTTPL